MVLYLVGYDLKRDDAPEDILHQRMVMQRTHTFNTFGRCLGCIFVGPVVNPVLSTFFSKENLNGVCVCVSVLSDTVHKVPGAACLSMSRGCRLTLN